MFLVNCNLIKENISFNNYDCYSFPATIGKYYVVVTCSTPSSTPVFTGCEILNAETTNNLMTTPAGVGVGCWLVKAISTTITFNKTGTRYYPLSVLQIN